MPQISNNYRQSHQVEQKKFYMTDPRRTEQGNELQNNFQIKTPKPQVRKRMISFGSMAASTIGTTLILSMTTTGAGQLDSVVRIQNVEGLSNGRPTKDEWPKPPNINTIEAPNQGGLRSTGLAETK